MCKVHVRNVIMLHALIYFHPPDKKKKKREIKLLCFPSLLRDTFCPLNFAINRFNASAPKKSLNTHNELKDETKEPNNILKKLALWKMNNQIDNVDVYVFVCLCYGLQSQWDVVNQHLDSLKPKVEYQSKICGCIHLHSHQATINRLWLGIWFE